MRLISALSSAASSFLDVVSWNRSPKENAPQRIFKKYVSSQVIEDPTARMINGIIVDKLPYYTLNTAEILQGKEGKVYFDFTDVNDQQPVRFIFENERTWLCWLKGRQEVDIWEIKDRRGDNPSIYYKLHKIDEWGFDHFASDKALFQSMTKQSGRLWKIGNVKNGKLLFIHTIDTGMGWSRKMTHVTRNFDELRFITGIEELFLSQNQGYPKETSDRQPTIRGATGALFLLGMLMSGKAIEFASNLPTNVPSWLVHASIAQFIAAKGGMGSSPFPGLASLGMSLLFENIPRATALPVALQPSINLTVNPGHSVNLTVSSFFKDSENATLGFSASPLPPFLAYKSNPSIKVGTIPTGDGRGGSQVTGNVLHTFGVQHISNGKTAYQTYDLSTFQRVGSSSYSAYTLSDGVVGPGGPYQAFYAYLAGGSKGLYYGPVDADGSNPNVNTDGPAQMSIDVVKLDQPNLRLWVNDGPRVNVSDLSPLFQQFSNYPIQLASFQENQNVTGIAVMHNGTGVIVISNPSGVLRKLDATNVTNLVSVGFLPLPGNPLGLSCMGDVCIVALGPNGFAAYNVSGSTPITISSYNPGNVSYHAATWNGLLFLSRSGQPFVDVFDVSDPTQPRFYGSVNLTYSPYSVFSIGNRIYVSTASDRSIHDLNFDFITGVPSALDQGTYEFNITAIDFIGGIATLRVVIQVLGEGTTTAKGLPSYSSINTPKPSSSSPSTGGIIAVAVFGGLIIVCLASGSYLILRKRQSVRREMTQALKRESTKDTFMLSPIVVTKDFDSVFGGGSYATLKWSQKEIEECYVTTGLIPDENGIIGHGHYGEVSMCWDNKNSRYAVMKVVDNPNKFEESKKEADLQLNAAGRGVWEIYHCVKDDQHNRLVLLFPPAGLKDLNYVSRRIELMKCEDKRELFAAFLAEDLLEGLVTLRKKKIGHFDLKSGNVLVSRDGTAGISDFGRGAKVEEKQIPAVKSDVYYKSPEQIDGQMIDVEREDVWGAGLTLLEFLLNQPASTILMYEIYRQKANSISYREHVKSCFAKIPQLTDSKEGTIWHVTKLLLEVDPEKRAQPSEVLTAFCMKQLDHSKKKELFGQLLPVLPLIKKKDTPSQQPDLPQLSTVGTSPQVLRRYENVPNEMEVQTDYQNAERKKVPTQQNDSDYQNAERKKIDLRQRASDYQNT